MKYSEYWLAIISVLVLAVVSMIVAAQGWGGCLPGFDLIPHVLDADKFIEKGVIPSYGCLSSLGSYIPPGTTWLLIPGRLLFSDPRLVAVPGASVLHFLTLAGIYCLGRWCWNRKVGILAVVLFAFSPLALGVVLRYWPCARFPMAATVWVAYFLCRWAFDKNAVSFGAAIVVLMLGLYVHLEGLLLLGVIPLLWLVYRPPVRLSVVAVALAVVLLVWWPYLRFEGSRDFSDLKSQLGQISLLYAKSTVLQVNRLAQEHGLPLLGESNSPAFAPGKMPLRARLVGFADMTAQKCVSVFQSVGSTFKSYGWGDLAALILSLIMLSFLFVVGLPLVRRILPFFVKNAFQLCIDTSCSYPRLLHVAGAALLCLAIVLNEWVLGRLLSSDGHLEAYTMRAIRLFQVVMAFVGLVFLFHKSLIRWLNLQGRLPVSRVSVLAVVLGVPWVAMAVMASPDVPYRFWYFWPLQVVVLVGMVTMAGQRSFRCIKLRLSKVASGRSTPNWALLIPVVGLMVMLFNPAVIERIRAWQRDGYCGETDEVRALQSLVEMIKVDGFKDVKIGYEVPFSPFMAYYHVFDERYKVGLPYDWYLKSAYGITNYETSPSGFSKDDRYRFASARPTSKNYLRLKVDYGHEWKMIGLCGDYSWWRKSWGQ